MQIDDEAIILKKKKYGESSLLITFFSYHHGIKTGIVKGAIKKDFGIYEIGNNVYIKCNFRLKNQLWNCKFELIKNCSVIFFDESIKLNALLSVCSLIDTCIPSDLPQANVYKNTINLIKDLKLKDWLNRYILWELFLLSEIGYGLDLKKCTVSGSTKNLAYVSPKSGKAVSKLIGNKYHDKLLKMPSFFINKTNKEIDKKNIEEGFRITGFFLNKYLKKNHNKGLPFCRKKILD